MFFLPGADAASHVDRRAWALNVASTVLLVPKPSQRPDSVRGQLRGEKECPFSGVTNSGRVWRKVLESDGRSVRGAVGSISSRRSVPTTGSCR